MTTQDQQSRAAPPWWRKRTDEIEFAVAAGKMSAAACYTQMLQLLDAERHAQAAPAPLTDERISEIDDETHFHESPDWPVRFARAIEAELRKAPSP